MRSNAPMYCTSLNNTSHLECHVTLGCIFDALCQDFQHCYRGFSASSGSVHAMDSPCLHDANLVLAVSSSACMYGRRYVRTCTACCTRCSVPHGTNRLSVSTLQQTRCVIECARFLVECLSCSVLFAHLWQHTAVSDLPTIGCASVVLLRICELQVCLPSCAIRMQCGIAQLQAHVQREVAARQKLECTVRDITPCQGMACFNSLIQASSMPVLGMAWEQHQPTYCCI
jgi:hypothetical protein